MLINAVSMSQTCQYNSFYKKAADFSNNLLLRGHSVHNTNFTIVHSQVRVSDCLVGYSAHSTVDVGMGSPYLYSCGVSNIGGLHIHMPVVYLRVLHRSQIAKRRTKQGGGMKHS